MNLNFRSFRLVISLLETRERFDLVTSCSVPVTSI